MIGRCKVCNDPIPAPAELANLERIGAETATFKRISKKNLCWVCARLHSTVVREALQYAEELKTFHESE